MASNQAGILEVIMAKRYQANEKDLDKVLNYLRIYHPDIATPETAIRVTEVMYVIAHESAAYGKVIDVDEAIKLAVKKVVSSKD
jgi:hypothetical protein